jgi:putative transposase
MELAVEMAPRVGVAPLCSALGLSRATFYRHRQSRPSPVDTGADPEASAGSPQDQSVRSPVVACDHGTEGATVPSSASLDETTTTAARSGAEPAAAPGSKMCSPRALSGEERERVIAVLDGERFCDLAPAEVYATLLDEGVYLCSERTMYRILKEHSQTRERRAQRRHPNYVAPELMATGPNQLWCWDITKLKTFVKSQYLHLYVILDVFSRYVVGWLVAERESGELAKLLIEETCERQGITPGELIFHADNGAAMVAQPVAFLLASLGITKSHSRPHVSDDNPFSEAQFKTLKYRPDFPARFASLEHARAFLRRFFDWYNTEHHHDGLALLTPYDVHHGLAPERLAQRACVLDAAYAAHPERFVRRAPKPAVLPEAVWINPPKTTTATQEARP